MCLHIVCLSACVSLYVCVHVFVYCLSVYLSVCLCIICLFLFLSVFVCLCIACLCTVGLSVSFSLSPCMRVNEVKRW